MDFESEPSTSTAAFVSKFESTNKSSTSSFKRCSTGQSALTLDSLPEDVLLELFPYLNSSDLSNLCACSSRIGQICQDRQLWRKVYDCCKSFRPHHDPLLSIFSDSNTYINVSCKKKVTLYPPSCRTFSSCLGRDFFRKLKNSPNLKTFILENHSFYKARFNLNYFPAGLTELRLNGCHLIGESKWKTAFANMHKQLPNLEILDLSRCYWVKLRVLTRIFECAKIKTLILFGCRVDISAAIIMTSRSSSPIFSSIETFDARKTRFELSNMVNWPVARKLRHLLLDHVPVDKIQWETPLRDYHIQFMTDCLENIETLVVRNDRKTLTDIMLMNLRTRCQSLKYLDITNTNCTTAAVSSFQNLRPDVKLLHECFESDSD